MAKSPYFFTNHKTMVTSRPPPNRHLTSVAVPCKVHRRARDHCHPFPHRQQQPPRVILIPDPTSSTSTNYTHGGWPCKHPSTLHNNLTSSQNTSTNQHHKTTRKQSSCTSTMCLTVPATNTTCTANPRGHQTLHHSFPLLSPSYHVQQPSLLFSFPVT